MARELKTDINERNKAIWTNFQQLWDDVAGAPLATMEERVLFLAERFSSQLNNVYTRVSTTLNQFPKTVQKKVEPSVAALNEYLVDFYNRIAEAQTYEEILNIQYQELVRLLEQSWNSIYDIATRRSSKPAIETNEKDRLSNGSASQCDGNKSNDSSSAVAAPTESDGEVPRNETENSNTTSSSSSSSSSSTENQNSNKCEQNDRNCQPNCDHFGDTWKKEDEHQD